VFELASSRREREAAVDPAALGSIALRWQMLVARDRRVIGVRLTMSPDDGHCATLPLGALLDGVLAGLVGGEAAAFPQGLVLLAPSGIDFDAAMGGWSAPGNVLLEVPSSILDDEARMRTLFEIRRRGVRQALRLQEPAPARERLAFFPYIVGPGDFRGGGSALLHLDGDSPPQPDAAFAAGAHAVIGWPLRSTAAHAEPLSPAQRAVFELIRLIQANADIRALERVFQAEPLLAYLLLTLANSSAFRRGPPSASLRDAVSRLGYQRLIKWLVLLLAISTKNARSAPLIFAATARGFLLENLCAELGRPQGECDQAFIVGAFSLLDAITGQALPELLHDLPMPAPVTDALLRGEGPFAAHLEHARAMESGDPAARGLAAKALGVGTAQTNAALLSALAAADAMRALV
jgi:EAL and modified HD-GYP domain-containing signal transduction protein